jgi:serine/threonine protein kinase
MGEKPVSLTGREIDGYQIGEQLGGGGMGEVYSAQKAGQKPVALKVVRSELSDPNIKERFRREIRLMMHLTHRHIVPILGHGESEDLLYLTMPIIQGPTLRELLADHLFTPESSLEILRPVADALAFMHSKGAMHRDVKPGNVFLEKTDHGWHPYIADLGLAKNPRFDRDLPALDRADGTIEYIAPDMEHWEDLDQQTDVYGLAAIAYELLLGELPYDIRKLPQKDRPLLPDPHELNPDFPHDLAQVLMRGLHPDKQKRYGSVTAFIQSYETAAKSLSPAARKKFYGAIDSNGENQPRSN